MRALSVLNEGSEIHLLSPNIDGPLGLLVFLDIQGIAHMRARWFVSGIGGVTTFRTRADNVYLLVGILVMLLWPWIFLAAIWKRDGIRMYDYVAEFIRRHPQRTSFFITFLGSIVSFIVSIIFSTAVLRFSQEWATNNDHVTVFDLSLISAFRNLKWPWGIKDHRYLLVRNRWLPVVFAGACIAAFTLVPSGTTSLLTPVPFNQTWPLIETELDFSSNVADCINWFAANPLPEDSCEWEVRRISQDACLTNHIYISEFQWCAIY